MDIAAALRNGARGIYTDEAAVELMIGLGKDLHDLTPWISRQGDDLAFIDPKKLQYESGAWSGGERRIVEIALSLLGFEKCDLSEVLPGIDRRLTRLVLAAVAHATGSHDEPEFVRNDDGTLRMVKHAVSLFPWPESGA